MATMMYPSLIKSQSMRTKRKSAVELLAESKPFYVKSEIVRDTTQAIPTRTTPVGGTYGRSSLGYGTNYRPTTMPPQYMAVSPSRSLPPLTHHRRSVGGSSSGGGIYNNNPNTSTINSNNDILQNKLRQLLVSDSSDNEDFNNAIVVEQMTPPTTSPILLSPPAEYAQRCHKSLPDLHCSSNKSSNKSLSNRDSGGSSGHYTQRSEPAPPPRHHQDTIRRDSGSSTQHSGGSSSYYCCQEPECYRNCNNRQPTTIFKRQKCLRYSNKRERPLILRSKSDISDRYWRPNAILVEPQQQTSHLEQFFEHLGLTTDSYEEMLSDNSSSPSASVVYFSDVSTVDSSRPVQHSDQSDHCQSGQTTFRSNSEPPSIIERNARIIKWLCNCRKFQLT